MKCNNHNISNLNLECVLPRLILFKIKHILRFLYYSIVSMKKCQSECLEQENHTLHGSSELMLGTFEEVT